MKKLVLVSLVLMAALPAVARVDVWCTTDKETVTVHYKTDANLPRAFALDIVSHGANIVSVNDANGDGYWVYPGSINFTGEDGGSPVEVNDYGTSVADANLYPGTLSGPNAMTVEMGSLYVGAANEPNDQGILLVFDVDNNADIDIDENAIRGGIVMEDPNEATDPNCTGCTVSVDCFPSALTAQYFHWDRLGKPLCWCNSAQGGTGDYQCDGDADTSTSGAPFYYRIYTGDLTTVTSNWKKKWSTVGINPCADVDHTDSGAPFYYQVYTGDLTKVTGNWKKKDTALPGDCPR